MAGAACVHPGATVCCGYIMYVGLACAKASASIICQRPLHHRHNTMALLLVLAAAVCFLAKQIIRPSSNKAGFYIGAFMSQLHIPIIVSNAVLVYLAHAFGWCEPSALHPVLLTMSMCAITAAYVVIAYDFLAGFGIAYPTPRFPVSKHDQKVIRHNHKKFAHPLAMVWARIIATSCPPMFALLRFWFNTKHQAIEYTDPRSQHKLHLDVITRRSHTPSESATVVLYVHGGAWMYGSKDYVGFLPAHHFASMGCVCVTINYRLSKPDGSGAVWPAHITDVKEAICWVKSNISKFGGNPDAIIIAGGSAGGHLAALAALTPNERQFQPGFEHKDTHVQGCIAIYGVFDLADQHDQWKAFDSQSGFRHPDPKHVPIIVSFLQKAVMRTRFHQNPQVFLDASPLYHAKLRKSHGHHQHHTQHSQSSSTNPTHSHKSQRATDVNELTSHAPHVPFLIVHGTRDILVTIEESRLLTQALNSDRATYFEVPGGHHAFDTFPSPRAYKLLDCMEEWIIDFNLYHRHHHSPSSHRDN